MPHGTTSMYKARWKLVGHTAAVSSAKFSPDGELIATCSDDASIRLWSGHNGEYKATLLGHVQGISDITWSPDGRFLVSGSDDKTVRIWDIESGRCERVLMGHTHHITCVDFNYKGNLVASGSADESIKIWDLKKGTCLRTLPAHSAPVSSISFSRDGTVLVSCGQDGLLRLWDCASGHCLRTLIGPTKSPALFVRFTPNNQYLIASTLDGQLRLWNFMTNKCVKTYETCALLGNDGADTSSAELNHDIEMTDAGSVKVETEASPELKYSTPIIFITKDSQALLGQWTPTPSGIKFWDVQTKKVQYILDEGHTDVVLGLDVTAANDRMVSSGKDRIAILWTSHT